MHHSEPSRTDRHIDRRPTFRDRQTRALTELLDERAELRGVHAFADHVDDAVRWTA